MSFWTDAAILGGAGIPSVLFGPTGAGLHGLEEWVEIESVLKCRDALVNLPARGVSDSRAAVHGPRPRSTGDCADSELVGTAVTKA